MLERDQSRKASEEMETRYQNQIAKLTQSLQQQEIERMTMEEEGREKEKELELVREEARELKRVSEGLRKEMEEQEKELNGLRQERNEWKERSDGLCVESKERSELDGEMEMLSVMKEENESLKSKLDGMSKENESLKEELEKKNRKADQEREKLAANSEELERLKQENETLREELEQKKEGVAMAEVVALKEELDKMNKVNASLREQLIKMNDERKKYLTPLSSSQLLKDYQIDVPEFSDSQLMEGESKNEPDFRTHPPDQFFYSSPLPAPSSSLEAYRLVISQLYREVLSLQRENQSLSAQLAAAEPLRITITPSAMEEESNAGMQSLIASMQMTMQTLQTTLKEKNDLIAKLNAQLQQLRPNPSLSGEFSLERGEVESESAQHSEEQTESEEEEEEEKEEEQKHGEEEKEREQQQDEEQQQPKDDEEEKEKEEIEDKDEKDEEGVSPKRDFSLEMQSAREEAERMRQSCEQLMEENSAKEKLLAEQHSREQRLSEEVSSLQQQVATLEAKREELQSLLSLSRQNVYQLSSLFKYQLGELRESFASLPPLLAEQQIALKSEMETTIRTIAAKYAFLTNHLLSSRQLISTLRDEIQNYKGNYRVMIRVRPINNTDTSTHSCIRITDEYNLSIQADDSRSEPKSFVFDRILPPSASQEELFLEVEPAVLSVFRGINCTILAYGQTGSGKTYSMVGEKGRLGLAFRICRLLFEEFRYRSDTSFELKVRFFFEWIERRSASPRFTAKPSAICSPRVGRSAFRSLRKTAWPRSASSPFLPLGRRAIHRRDGAASPEGLRDSRHGHDGYERAEQPIASARAVYAV